MSGYLVSLTFAYSMLIPLSGIYSQTGYLDSLRMVCQKNPEASSTLILLNILSSDLTDLGEYKDAKMYGEQALTLAKKLNSATGQYTAHINIGNSSADDGETDVALLHYQHALDIARELKDPKAQSECLNNIGLVYYYTARYDDALHAYHLSLELRKQANNVDGQIDSYTNIGNVHTESGNYPEALASYLECLRLSENQMDSRGQLDSYNNISVLLLRQAKIPEAIKYLDQAIRYANHLDDNEALANICNNYGVAYYMQQDMQGALQKFKEALRYRAATSDLHGLSMSYNNVGAIYEQENQLDSALVYFDMARKVQLQLDDNRSAGATMLNMAIVETKQSNFSKARALLDEALALSQKHHITDMLRDIHLQYAMVDSLDGNWANAYAHIRKHNAYKDSLFNESVNEQIETLKIRFESEKKEKENLSLRYENQHQHQQNLLLRNQQEITALRLRTEQDRHLISQNLTRQQADSIRYLDNQRKTQETLSEHERNLHMAETQLHQKAIQRKNLILFVAGLLVVLTGIIIYLASRARKKRIEAEMKEIEEKALRAQLKPHFVFNALASIQNYVRENPVLAENFLSKFSQFTQEVLVNSEKKFITLSDELAMLGKYIDLHSLRLRQPIEYTFVLDPLVDPDDILVPPAILQPLIENSINHNFASKQQKGIITLTCKKEGGLLRCDITDKCEGTAANIAPNGSRMKDRKSFGLEIVRERLALWSKGKAIKGFLELFPQNDGMRVVLGIPQA